VKRLVLMLLMLSATVFAARAGLVVQFDNSSVFKKCVDFKDGDSAFEFIKNSGLGVATQRYQDLGIALCRIGSFGCESDNCFCKPEYWGFYRMSWGQWVYSEVGIADYKMREGDVVGFRWGSYGSTPEMHSFSELCMNEAQNQTRAIITAPRTVPVDSTVVVKLTSEDGKPLVYEKVVVEFAGGWKELVTNESGEATFSANQQGVYEYSSPNHLLNPLKFTSVEKSVISLTEETPATSQEETAQPVAMAISNPSPVIIGGGVVIILALLYLLRGQLKR